METIEYEEWGAVFGMVTKNSGIVKESCVFCHPELEGEQQIILENDSCMFLQLKAFQQRETQLAGAGVIVPKAHRETVFDLTEEEWEGTYELLKGVKLYLDHLYHPDGYNVGWNSGETAGQHIFHAHLHILPRYKEEPLAGKGIRYMFKQEKMIKG